MLDVRRSIALAVLCWLGLATSVQAEIGKCGEPATPIHEIQGAGVHTDRIDKPEVIEGVVVGDFQTNTLHGFYVEEEDSQQDADPATSEGMFVFQENSTVDVAVGQLVRVAGHVFEFDGTTELTHVRVLICPGTPLVTPHKLEFPLPDRAELERYEGMLVEISQPLTVTGNYDLGRYGTLELSVGGRLFQPTQLASKGPAALALTRENDLRRILLDDADGRENPLPIPYKSSDNTRRVGDTLPHLRGILDDRFDAYRIMPVEPPQFEPANPRPPAPGRAGRLRVASANVFNYFTTLDDHRPHCGPSGAEVCRGANNPQELARQRA
jgi:predicted extracellular nuclease